MYFIHYLTLYDNMGFEKCFGIMERSSFLKFCVYVFSFLYFLFFVNFLLYVTFFFRYFFSFISCVLFISKSCILYPKGYIIFCLSKTLSKKQAKCKAKHKANFKQKQLIEFQKSRKLFMLYPYRVYIGSFSFCFSFASNFA